MSLKDLKVFYQTFGFIKKNLQKASVKNSQYKVKLEQIKNQATQRKSSDDRRI